MQGPQAFPRICTYYLSFYEIDFIKKIDYIFFFQRNFGEFEIPRDLIDRGEKLGSGSFGTVYSGIYHSPNDGDVECAIKEAKNEELGDNMREKLLDEAYIMRCVFVKKK